MLRTTVHQQAKDRKGEKAMKRYDSQEKMKKSIKIIVVSCLFIEAIWLGTYVVMTVEYSTSVVPFTELWTKIFTCNVMRLKLSLFQILTLPPSPL